MGNRANFVVIKNGTAAAYYDQWAALGCSYDFAYGPEQAVLKKAPPSVSKTISHPEGIEV